MRSLLIVCVVVGLALTAGMACAAQPGQVSDSALAQLGLGGMQQMTDVQGMAIRASGLAMVSGSGTAWVVTGNTGGKHNKCDKGSKGGSKGAIETTCFSAQSGPGTTDALAFGANVSIAAVGSGKFPACGNPSGQVTGAIAIGGAIAFAK